MLFIWIIGIETHIAILKNSYIEVILWFGTQKMEICYAFVSVCPYLITRKWKTLQILNSYILCTLKVYVQKSYVKSIFIFKKKGAKGAWKGWGSKKFI